MTNKEDRNLKDKPVKTFHIKFKDTAIIIETEGTKDASILKMIRTLFLNVSNSNPDALDELMKRFNSIHKAIKRERQIKAARKAGKPIPKKLEVPEPVNDFEFWERLIREVPNNAPTSYEQPPRHASYRREKHN